MVKQPVAGSMPPKVEQAIRDAVDCVKTCIFFAAWLACLLVQAIAHRFVSAILNRYRCGEVIKGYGGECYTILWVTPKKGEAHVCLRDVVGGCEFLVGEVWHGVFIAPDEDGDGMEG